MTSPDPLSSIVFVCNIKPHSDVIPLHRPSLPYTAGWITTLMLSWVAVFKLYIYIYLHVYILKRKKNRWEVYLSTFTSHPWVTQQLLIIHICKLHPCHHIMCLQMCYELLTIVYHIIYICLLECLECLFLPYDKNGFSTPALMRTNQPHRN